MSKKPEVSSFEAAKEVEKVEAQFVAQEEQRKSLTKDVMDQAPDYEGEPQTQLSKREINRSDALVIKPSRAIQCKEPHNPKFEALRQKAWEYVKCIVENKEVIGEDVQCWTKAFPGDPAQFWKVPVNKPIAIPRLLADQLSKCKYHRLRMEESQTTSQDGMATYHGAMVVDSVVPRIECRPVGFTF